MLFRLFLFVSLCAMVGCSRSPVAEVIVYCAVDREFAQPVLDAFERKTGIRVQAKFDTESTKSVALAEQILRERNRPRCDVFWNNEILHTLRIEQAGLLRPTEPTEMSHYPASSRCPKNHWHGIGARARVLLVNEDRVDKEMMPNRLEDLTDPRWSGTIGVAKPLFGTTASHLSALAEEMGRSNFEEFVAGLKRNQVQVLSGNKQVAVDVGSGVLAMGLTDTDDALAEVAAGRPVRMVYLDQGASERGILLIPNTVAALAGSPHPREGNALVDFLVSKEAESLLNNARCGQVPLHDELRPAWEPSPKGNMKAMIVDWRKVAEHWSEVQQLIQTRWLSP